MDKNSLCNSHWTEENFVQWIRKNWIWTFDVFAIFEILWKGHVWKLIYFIFLSIFNLAQFGLASWLKLHRAGVPKLFRCADYQKYFSAPWSKKYWFVLIFAEPIELVWRTTRGPGADFGKHWHRESVFFSFENLIPGVPGILAFIDKNIELLNFLSLFGFAKTIQLLITQKKLRHKLRITPRAWCPQVRHNVLLMIQKVLHFQICNNLLIHKGHDPWHTLYICDSISECWVFYLFHYPKL